MIKWREEGEGTEPVIACPRITLASGEMRGSGVRSVALMMAGHCFTFDSRREVEEFIKNVRIEADLAWPRSDAS